LLQQRSKESFSNFQMKEEKGEVCDDSEIIVALLKTDALMTLG
jgi:hypothetical protein